MLAPELLKSFNKPSEVAVAITPNSPLLWSFISVATSSIDSRSATSTKVPLSEKEVLVWEAPKLKSKKSVVLAVAVTPVWSDIALIAAAFAWAVSSFVDPTLTSLILMSSVSAITSVLTAEPLVYRHHQFR